MFTRRLIIGLSTVLFLAHATACAPLDDEWSEEEWDGAAYDEEEVSSEALLSPPPGLGFSYIGTMRITNSQYGECSTRVGSVLGLTTCRSDSAQAFAIYQHSNGTYSMCTPGTLTAYSFSCVGGTCTDYRATCVTAQGSGDIRLAPVALSKNYTTRHVNFSSVVVPIYTYAGPWTPSRDISLENSMYLKINGRYMTRNSSAVVVQGGYSGQRNQQWSTATY